MTHLDSLLFTQHMTYSKEQALFLLDVFDRYLREQLYFYRIPIKEQSIVSQVVRIRALDKLIGHNYFSQGVFQAWYRQVIFGVIIDHYRTGQRYGLTDKEMTSRLSGSGRLLSVSGAKSLKPPFSMDQLLIMRMRCWERKTFRLISGELLLQYDTVVGRYRQAVRLLPPKSRQIQEPYDNLSASDSWHKRCIRGLSYKNNNKHSYNHE